MFILLFQLFSSEEDDTDLSDNFVVKTCQKFIPVTGKFWMCISFIFIVEVLFSDHVYAIKTISQLDIFYVYWGPWR